LLTERDKKRLRSVASKRVRATVAVLVVLLVISALAVSFANFLLACKYANEIGTTLSDTTSRWLTGSANETSYLGGHVMSVEAFDKSVGAALLAAAVALIGLLFWMTSNTAGHVLASAVGAELDAQPADGSDAATPSEGDASQNE
jgi:flagellar basal body-associated protein FliL